LISPVADGTHAASASEGGPQPVRVTVVQGGGPQGTHAAETSRDNVFERHLQATGTIAPGSADLVLWPENVIDVVTFAGSPELSQVAAEAKRIGAPIAVGVTEDVPGDRFVNSQMIVTPDGQIFDRYDKVRRVPFGEYMPLRGLLHAIGAPTDLVPRDAVPGSDPAVLHLPDGTTMAVVISWEIFFGGRVNDGVAHGGQFIINPTNGSSYTWTVLQSQQIASSRLRAMEQGRWVAQASPTGFSAFITPSGDVLQRTGVSHCSLAEAAAGGACDQAVISQDIQRRTGRTWYSYTGTVPWVVVMALLFGGAWVVPGRQCAAIGNRSARRHRNRRRRLHPVQHVHRVVRGESGHRGTGLHRGRPEVRHEHRVVALQQARVNRWLGLEHVEPRAGDPPALQGVH
jgi:apolipoprotein N-acyltransferase